MPVTAVTRIAGQYFCFLAVPGPQGGSLRARRRSTVGEVKGNDYVVKSGVKAGDRLIVSGIQKIGDGAPVQAQSPDQAAAQPAARPSRRLRQSSGRYAFQSASCLSIPSSSARSWPAVCSLVIILAGAVAIPTMPVAQYPDLAPPQVSVTAIYNGANAQAVETAVTTPLEQALNGVEGMLYLSSSSTNAGISQITVTFDVTRNSDIAAVDVQNRVSQALGRLPPEVRALGVTVQKNSTGFVLGAGVYAENGAYDSLFLSNYIDVNVKDALKRVPGVGDVILFGERRYSMRLWLDPAKLAARGLTASDVANALREQNVQIAAGSVGDAPSVPGQMYQISVRAEGRLQDAHQFDDIIVKAGAGRLAGAPAPTSDTRSSARRATARSCASRASRRSASA